MAERRSMKLEAAQAGFGRAQPEPNTWARTRSRGASIEGIKRNANWFKLDLLLRDTMCRALRWAFIDVPALLGCIRLDCGVRSGTVCVA